ncbi:MAG: hypothetical protein AABY07_03410 [Nanoarchaeota archaeon]
MGLFSRKKKELPERNLPEFPRFPEMPSYNEQRTVAPMPTYEPEFKQKDEIPERRPEPVQRQPETQPIQSIREPERPSWTEQRRADIPVRTEPSYQRSDYGNVRPEFRAEERPYRVASPPPITRFEPDVWKPPRQEIPVTETRQEERQFSRPEQVQQQANQEKPVFVKIEQYREVMTSIEVLKQKLKEVESIIERLSQIRTQEQSEITSCQDNVNKIKEKLIDIDKKLFEV